MEHISSGEFTSAGGANTQITHYWALMRGKGGNKCRQTNWNKRKIHKSEKWTLHFYRAGLISPAKEVIWQPVHVC